MKITSAHSVSLIHSDVLLLRLCSVDADEAFGAERDGPEGRNDGSAGLRGGAEIPPRPHLHLPGPRLHALRHLPHCQCGS